MKRKAFTLIELMVAVVVIAILMSIVFRLSGTGSDSQKRNLTASRLQRLENCLSGYYAAFGSYPPVPTQRSSRNFRLKVNSYGVQDPDKENQNELNWDSVEAACRAQSVATRFPFRKDMNDWVMNISKQLQKKANSGEKRWKDFDSDALRAGFDNGSKNKNDTVSSEDTVFEFGLMSFLLPRYQFMLGCESEYLTRAEWIDNNELPSDPENGSTLNGWDDVRDWGFDEKTGKAKSTNDQWKFAMVPSQAVCARWMPNLEGSCRVLTGQKFFGISIGDGSASALSAENPGVAGMIRYPHPVDRPGVNGYVLNSITILDGWGNEFYYYSAPPYQNYTLWSAGPNGKTFCPWVPLDTLSSDEAAKAGNWMADDIIQMGY